MSQGNAAANFLIRVLVETCLAGHLVVAALYWWLSPKGFAPTHCRFWLNSVIPLVVIVAICTALAVVLRRRAGALSLVLLCVTTMWSAAAFSASIWFQASLGNLWYLGVAVAFCAGCLVGIIRRYDQLPIRLVLPATAMSAAVGSFAVWAQRPPPADTSPINAPVTAVHSFEQYVASSPEKIGEEAWFYPAAGELALKRKGVTIRCTPLLTFERVSPDGFWSLLAPRNSTTRSIRRRSAAGDTQTFEYSDGSSITLPLGENLSRIQITASCNVEVPTFSHLNTFCLLEIAGHRQLSMSFSPCDQVLIDVLPADYPTGRPARFAYLGESGAFSIVEATSGEKGPFRELAKGKLGRGEPLRITFHDQRHSVASVVLNDWSQQLSTTVSPTAGWGVPVNAIEFQRTGDLPESPAAVWITLAATSVGRGWDTVGHRAGTYRNRLEIR